MSTQPVFSDSGQGGPTEQDFQREAQILDDMLHKQVQGNPYARCRTARDWVNRIHCGIGNRCEDMAIAEAKKLLTDPGVGLSALATDAGIAWLLEHFPAY
jgi:hypothetical protein